MTKKRVLSLMLAGVLAVSMMTACGGGSSDKGGSDKQTTAAANSGSEGGQAASDDRLTQFRALPRLERKTAGRHVRNAASFRG